MLVRRDPGELYALRHDMPVGGLRSRPVQGWVERLHPETLTVLAATPRLPGGMYWPGGIAAHASGDLHMVFGRWAHRLSADLEVLASHRLPVPRPHNSFVVLDAGELVTKDCDAPVGREPATVSVLDPETLLPVAAALRLPEPCIARLASDGESVIAVGTATVFRLRLERDAPRLTIDGAWQPRYGPAPGRGYGWDPVITDDRVFWMDNGANRVDRTMLGSGDHPEPVRLWWARHDDGVARCTEISGLPRAVGGGAPRIAPDRARPPRRPRPRHGRREGAHRGALADAGLPVPGPRLQARPLLPVADHDRAYRRGLSATTSGRGAPVRSPGSRTLGWEAAR
jgi:hypothetical protein